MEIIGECYKNFCETTNQQESFELRTNFYVYEYFIKDSGDVFYVGKGVTKRAWKDTRNAACEQIKKDMIGIFG
ncbi:hypothetical protein [Peribacillus sp. JNUCC41]|uniref:hypothetical protein n=1 Tax=Peribacillus sp. JNUCC41 TaxID=2778370 RepID=UPI00177F5277|nr:hypothetical protein [Brevibacillus sp. JNUCC-41]QOS88750.1 hypothetical protein JNUCC41_18270 [Brevibacillus sp. JNUCC-41]